MKKWKHVIGTLTTISMVASMTTAFPASAADLMNPPIAEVKQGQLRGYMDGDTYAFLGVPYATVSERFGMPEEVEPWEGIRDAQTYGAVSPISPSTSVGSDEMVWPHRYWIQNEECQFLNIWTQQLDSTAKKPVMVFMHGGGYSSGSSIEGVAYEGKNLSDYGDVVVVTLNHRLNALGFLDLSAYGEEYKYSGNAGLADLVAALEWIQENIASFGGDPDNVTIFGQSAGGGKVTCLLRTPAAEGIIDKVICQSGGFSGISKENAQKVTAQTLENLGLDESEFEQLKTIPYSDLIAASSQAFNQVSQEVGESLRWSPVIDEDYLHSDYCDWSADVPMIVGSVFSEFDSTLNIGDGRKNEWTEDETMENLTERYGDNAAAIAEEFSKIFPDKKLADAYFYAPVYRQRVKTELDAKLVHASAPVYSYLFTYEAPVNGGTTAFHCSDLIYAFHNVEIPILTRATGGNEDALRLQDQVASAWVNFAKTGDPSQDGLEWAAYTDDDRNIMRFDVESGCSALGDETLIELMTAK